jgi:hypothetical protein
LAVRLTLLIGQIVLNVVHSSQAHQQGRRQDARMLPPIEVHTCDFRMVINLDPGLQNVLRESCSLDDSRFTMFDNWFHSQVILTGYNRA